MPRQGLGTKSLYNPFVLSFFCGVCDERQDKQQPCTSPNVL